MMLTSQQRGFLTEVCIIGTSRAASQLSILLNDSVNVSVPNVDVSSVSDLPEALNVDKDKVYVVVSQGMSGCFDGRAALMFNNADCNVLVESVLKGFASLDEAGLVIYKQESMIEIGNIIVSASVSALADLLKSEVLLTVPEYKETSLHHIFGLNNESPVIAVTTQLQSNSGQVSGILLFMFERSSITVLLDLLTERSKGI